MNFIKQIGQGIIIEGLKAVAVGAGLVVVTKLVTDGVKGVKELSLDDLLD